MKTEVMGVQFDNVTMEEALSIAQDCISGEKASYCVTPNAEIVYTAMHDAAFRTLLNDASLVLPDGAGVVLGAKILKTPLKGKVAGIDFAARLLSVLEENGSSLYLLGSKPGIAELAKDKILLQHPKLNVVGVADGYFQDEAPVVDRINQASPDVLFVCLGAPKQEIFMRRHLSDLRVRFMIGLGGSLDGFAGTVKRAPKWMIRLQLEWLYRLIKEPKRFKRMLCLPKFVWATMIKRLKG